MTLIVVEGPDGSGKTTLISELRKSSLRYFWILRASRNPKSPLQLVEAANFLDEIAQRNFPTCITDRHPMISEPIYGPILRETYLCHPGWPSSYLRKVKRVIYCRPPDKIIEGNILMSPQLPGIDQKLPEIIAAYDKTMDQLRSFPFPIIYYDYTASVELNLDKLVFGDA